jgi:hypothetical protein
MMSIQAVAAFFSGLSAIAWLIAALIPVPTRYDPAGFFITPEVSGEEQRIHPFVPTMKRQSLCNAVAAACMMVSTSLQAVILFLQS